MKDAIIGLTGAARDFLVVDQGFKAQDLLDLPTKYVANKLEKWREKQGMEPLKGTGKVANISTWKANAKEALEVEADAGKVVPNLTEIYKNKLALEPVESTTGAAPPPKKKRKKRLKINAVAGDRSVDYALHSKLFLEDALGKDVAAIVFQADIKTAAELFDADTKHESSLYRVVIDSGRASCGVSFNRAIDFWRAKLRKDLDKLGQRAPEIDAFQLTAKPQPQEAPVYLKRPRIDQDSTNSSAEASSKDPFDALSATTRKFLKSINVTTAAAFLTTRTTDIAQDFIKWRAAIGLAELKGIGAISSVSSWKAVVRNKAKELGL